MPVYADIGIDQMPAIAVEIIKSYPSQRFFVVRGEMGAGKTTLIREICKELKVESSASSPTFALINEYFSPHHGNIYHFDLYRIKHINEVFDIGYEDYFFSGNYCFIEWAEKIAELLPSIYVEVSIEISTAGRDIFVELTDTQKQEK